MNLQNKNSNIHISIILPTYNGKKYLETAIKSILDQSYKLIELIIVDDGSSDGTEELILEIKKYDSRIIYIKNEVNLGIQKSLNKGLKNARGEYIARIDDDDEWIDKDKIKKQFEFLEKNIDHVIIGTGVIVQNEDRKELFRYVLPESDIDIRKRILSKNCFVHSSVVFRKTTALLVGGYNESEKIKHVEDYDLWLKLGTKGKFHNLQSYSVKFTLREGSISSINKLDQFKKNIKLIKNFKDKYPKYLISYSYSILKLPAYSFIIKFKIKSFMNRLIKFYKEKI